MQHLRLRLLPTPSPLPERLFLVLPPRGLLPGENSRLPLPIKSNAPRLPLKKLMPPQLLPPLPLLPLLLLLLLLLWLLPPLLHLRP